MKILSFEIHIEDSKNGNKVVKTVYKHMDNAEIIDYADNTKHRIMVAEQILHKAITYCELDYKFKEKNKDIEPIPRGFCTYCINFNSDYCDKGHNTHLTDNLLNNCSDYDDLPF